MRIMSVVAGLCIALAGCAFQPAPNLTPLQIETIQTHEYETDKNTVFAGIVSVFQTLGYTIKVADKDTGLITAESLSKEVPPGLWGVMTPIVLQILIGIPFDGYHGYHRHHGYGGVKTYSTSVVATAFVEDVRAGVSRVRLNFVSRRFAQGGNRSEEQILKPAFYRNAFEKIANAIFLRTSTK